MKKYCLKPEAKSELLKQIAGILVIIAFLLFVGGLIALPFSFFIAPHDIVSLILCYIGILSWTIVFSFIVINIKLWLQSNIIEC